MNNQTGILLFSRLPQYEAQVKQLVACKEKNARLWRHLYNNTLVAARKSKLPLIRCQHDVQEGNSFSERITTAIESAFRAGLEHVVVIGSDCPGMNAEEIKQAAQLLQSGKEIVAGADHRGGVYLFGISKKAFNSNCFKKFRWQTSELLNDLCSFAANFKFEFINNTLADVHCFEDIKDSLNASQLFSNWRILIIRLFFSLQKIYSIVYAFFKSNFPVNQTALRAPPVSC